MGGANKGRGHDPRRSRGSTRDLPSEPRLGERAEPRLSAGSRARGCRHDRRAAERNGGGFPCRGAARRRWRSRGLRRRHAARLREDAATGDLEAPPAEPAGGRGRPFRVRLRTRGQRRRSGGGEARRPLRRQPRPSRVRVRLAADSAHVGERGGSASRRARLLAAVDGRRRRRVFGFPREESVACDPPRDASVRPHWCPRDALARGATRGGSSTTSRGRAHAVSVRCSTARPWSCYTSGHTSATAREWLMSPW